MSARGSNSKVLVAGASGFVGSHTARLLASQGRSVRVMLRATSRSEALAGLPIELVRGDVLDAESLHAAMRGCSTVFYCVVDPRFWLTDPTPIYRNNVEGLDNAMDAALSCGVERFIFTSSMGTLGLDHHAPVSEAVEFNWHDRASPYILARLEAENRFLACCRERALPGIALCIANTYGPQDYAPTPHGKALWDTARGALKVALDASAPMVDIRDVAQAAVLAETRGRVGERYIIANELVSNRELYTLAASQLGHRPPRFIPLRAAYAIAWLTERMLRLLGKRDSLISTDAVFLSNVFQAMDNTKARTELGWRPRPMHETVRDAVAWYAQNSGSSSTLQPVSA